VRASDLPDLMNRVGYTEIHFADDRDIHPGDRESERLVEDYAKAVSLCHAAGFAPRTRALSGGVCIGRPSEDLAERTRLITLVAHHAGSVVVWPYQSAPRELPEISLEQQNGKLFPFRGTAGATYREYADLLGLAALLS